MPASRRSSQVVYWFQLRAPSLTSGTSPPLLQTALAVAPVSPQDLEVDAGSDDSGEDPDEDVTGAEEPSRHKRNREPRDHERAEHDPDAASDIHHFGFRSVVADDFLDLHADRDPLLAAELTRG